MWLINTQSLALEFFTSSKSVPYVILSHTWEEEEEVTFQEFKHLRTAKRRKGFGKIRETCSIAKSRGIGYAWVDTCCINKDSSAELSEAINSMFRWYKHAAACLVYLSDLAPGTPKEMEEQWGACRWFTRGWTLQELIAPAEADFFDREWLLRGSKTSLSRSLASVTGIDHEVLTGDTSLAELPVARKMSWASRRRTTRDEDIAYCLMGIFGINMPLLYGEGYKAFIRLQEEILKQTRDLSLLAWTSQYPEMYPFEDAEETDESPGQAFRGLFACSPLEFSQCGTVVQRNLLQRLVKASDFSITSQLLHLNLPTSPGAPILEIMPGTVRDLRPARSRIIMGESGIIDSALILHCCEEVLWDDVAIVIAMRETRVGFVRTRARGRFYVRNYGQYLDRRTGKPPPLLAHTHVSAFVSRTISQGYSWGLWLPPLPLASGLFGPNLMGNWDTADNVNSIHMIGRTRGVTAAHILLQINQLISHGSIRDPGEFEHGDGVRRNPQFRFIIGIDKQLIAADSPHGTGGSVDVAASHGDPLRVYWCVLLPESAKVLKALGGHVGTRGYFMQAGVEVGYFSDSRTYRGDLRGRDNVPGTVTVELVPVPLPELGIVDTDSSPDPFYAVKLSFTPASTRNLRMTAARKRRRAGTDLVERKRGGLGSTQQRRAEA